jgi:ADP-heptose:LPS heptosyltransferase
MHFRLKRLEQATNRLCVHAFSRLVSTPPSERPDWGAGPQRVLYLRYDRIGDMIVSTGLINAIARSHPTITLDVLASPANAPVLAGNPNVSSVIIWDKARIGEYARLVSTLRRARYDAVIDCTTLNPSMTTLLLMLVSGARHRIGIGGRSNDDALTVKVSPSPSASHHIDRSAVLATAFGVDVDSVDWRPTLFFSEGELNRAERIWSEYQSAENSGRMRRLLVNISAGLSNRRWPRERFIDLLNHLRATAPMLNVILICAHEDIASGRKISEASNVPLIATPRLRDALALVATTDAVLTPDTSIGHAASACRKPAVILFLQGTEAKWGRYGIPGFNVSSSDETLTSLTLERVRDAVDMLIKTNWNAC